MLIIDIKINRSTIIQVKALNKGEMQDLPGWYKYSWTAAENGRELYTGNVTHERNQGAEILTSLIMQELHLERKLAVNKTKAFIASLKK